MTSKEWRVTQEGMSRYSGPGNIHSDGSVAASVGLSRTVAQGMMTLAVASDLLRTVHGDAWLERGEIAVRFTGLVYPDDTVTVRIDEERVEAHNQNGELVMVGDARLR